MSAQEETITADEVDSLLKQAASRDQRTTSTPDVIAWWQDLNIAKVTYPAAQEALAHYYASVWPRQAPRDRFRITAPALIEIVLAFRKERLANSNYVYTPDGDENGFEYVGRLRRELAQVAAGNEPPKSISQALRARPAQAAIEAVAGRLALPPEITEVLERRRHPARDLTCPHCRALAGKPCHDGNGHTLRAGVHPGRTDAWAVNVTPCPECRAGVGDGCRELGHPYQHGAHKRRVETALNSVKEPSE